VKLILSLLVLVSISCLSIVYIYDNFDFKKRDKELLEVSKKRAYVVPAFKFKSKKYREFVYVK